MFSTVLNIIDAVWCPASSLNEFTIGVPKQIGFFMNCWAYIGLLIFNCTFTAWTEDKTIRAEQIKN